MKFLTVFSFFTVLVIKCLSQIPTINPFPGNSTAAPGFSGATGTTMTINGTNFTGTTAVSFGGTAAASFTVVSATRITAVVGAGTTGSVTVTNATGTSTPQPGFTYLPLSRIITDFGGYWSTNTATANITQPDTSHHLLGFTYNNVLYSTGINDPILSGQGLTFTPGSYRALPVAGIAGTNTAPSVYLAMAAKVDGSAGTAVLSGVSNSTIKSVMTDGIRGLNLGTGVTNLPTSAVITLNITSIDPTKILDAEPDLLITQIADPAIGNDVFKFIDAGGATVGNTVTQDMTALTSFGSYKLDLFAFAANAPYNTATPSSVYGAANTTRTIRMVAFKLSDFGITAGNVASIKALTTVPSGNSDYAFIAYNTNAIIIQPGISINDGSTTSTVCTNGTAVLSVVGSAVSGGSLAYSWERSTNGGNSWAAVTDGGDFSGATTTSLSITNPVNADQYRATITETPGSYTNTSAVFTLTVSPLTVAGSVSGGATKCAGTNNTVLTLSGQTGSVVKWQSSTNNFSTSSDIANTTATLTAIDLSTTTQYRAVVQSGPCASANSSSVTVSIIPASVGGFVSTNATVCTGSNSTALTLSGYTGSIIKWESSTNSFTSSTNIVNTITTFTATNLTSTTQYRAVIQSGSCAVVNSVAATVTVSPATVGGSVSGAATVCTGTNSTILTLSGNTGSVTKWQSSTDNFVTPLDIANTTGSLTANNLAVTTKYRAVIQSGACASAFSATATLTVNPANVGGTVSGGATVCTGTNSTNLALSGNTGNVTKWQSSTDYFATPVDIVNTTGSLSAVNLTNTTQYRAVVQSGVCASAFSSTATITINAASAGGSVGGATTVCTGTNSTNLTLSSNVGSINKWQSSTDNFSSVIDDVVNTTTSLMAVNLTATTQYRAVVQSGVCGSVSSAIAVITVNQATVGGSINGTTTVCTGLNSTNITLSGSTGSIIRWQSSTDNFTAVINDIVNTTTSLTAANLTATTQYRAVLQSGVCSSAFSTTATITVNVATAGGTISGDRLVCSGANSTLLILSGSTGGILKWQSSTDNFLTPVDIVNSTTSLTAVNLTAITKYRAVVQNGVCAQTFSSVAVLTVAQYGEWIGGAAGDYHVPANWCGGVPSASANVVIPANSIVYIDSNNVTLNSLNISATGSMVMLGSYHLTIAANGSLVNNGSFDASASTGAVSFAGNGTVSGTITFKNVETSGALDFGATSTVSGNFTIQPGGSLTGHAPVYTCPSSALVYNTGGTFNRSMEWLPASSGAGYPSNVIIQNNTSINFPAGGDGHVCRDLTIAAGSGLYQDYSAGSAAIDVGRNVNIRGILSLGAEVGGNISLGGDWTRDTNGVFNHNNRSVIFTGSGNSVITAPHSVSKDANGALGGETFYDVQINKASTSASVSLGSNISVKNEVRYSAGTFDLANSDVTLVSNATSTAYIAALPTASGIVSGVEIRYGGIPGTGTGKFVVQRHLSISNEPSARRWRLLTLPLQATGAPTINAAWQEGVSSSDRNAPVDPWPGYGTTITKSNEYDPSNGYDRGSTNNASLYYFSDGAWAVLPATNAAPVTDHEGYMLFARGNRSIQVSTPSIDGNSTTLEPKGRINIGDIGKTLSRGFQVIGNPYASAIDFSKLLFTNYTSGGSTFNTTPGSLNGVGLTYYIWDPQTNGSGGVGKFITCSSNGNGTYSVTSNTGNLPADGTIPSGAAFMIYAENAGGTIKFHEADKLNSTNPLINRHTATVTTVSTFTTNLYVGKGAGAKLADAVITAYAGFNNNVDGQDAIFLSTFNTAEALSITRNGTHLSVERRKDIIANDTTFLSIKNLAKAGHQFIFKPINFNPSMYAGLEDKFTGLSTPLSVIDSTVVSFEVTADTNSFAPDRFKIVFKPPQTLPSTLKQLKVFHQNNNNVVQWTVENLLNFSKYEVERSADGTFFTKLNTTMAGGSVQRITYYWVDKNVLAEDNYYRIKCIGHDGTFVYSKILRVAFESGKSYMSVYPNPVTNGNITLHLPGISQGSYQIRIINKAGKLVFKTTLVYHTGDVPEQGINLKNLPGGSYHIEITGPGTKIKGVQIIIE